VLSYLYSDAIQESRALWSGSNCDGTNSSLADSYHFGKRSLRLAYESQSMFCTGDMPVNPSEGKELECESKKLFSHDLGFKHWGVIQDIT